ncbi:sulfatase [Olivibacter ginsenosidimutans]|uniref:Sulfatase n=1 Tax=Olivibacter ginsenosidimutans TaxID=1176537 RepID=A0ABP9BUH6_9SPHI
MMSFMRIRFRRSLVVSLAVCIVGFSSYKTKDGDENESIDVAFSTAKPLNIVLFTADDLDRNSLSCYGSTVKDITPNIDRFAKQSLNFKNAYVNAAICVPSRGILATGRYPHNNGVNGFFKMKAGNPTPLLMEILRKHHYTVGILGKLGHSTPKSDFIWDYAFDQADLGDGRSPSLYYERTKAFFEQCKKGDKPFYFMVNSHDPHRPFFDPEIPLKNGQERPSKIYAPEDITVPGFVPDLPGVRKELSYYFNSVRRLDDTFGRVMQALEESGYANNTLVIFLSDNGIAIPFAKANAYYASNRTPFLVRWLGVTKEGTANDDDFIATVDYLPTLLDALHIPLPDGVDGRSFLPLLQGKQQNDRTKVYAEIDYKAGGGATPIRSVQNKRYTYIFNAWADGERVYANNNEGLTLKSMIDASATNAKVAARVNTYQLRAPEEFYDLEHDPDALHNLIHEPRYQGEVARFRKDLEAWMVRTYDPLVKVYQLRNKPSLALQEFYKLYPEAKELDQDKQRYSRGGLGKRD